MKKTIILLLVVCLLGGAAAGFLLGRSEKAAVPAETAAAPEEVGADETVTAADPAADVNVPLLDYAKLYGSHSEDEVVVRVNGRDVTWAEYFYLLMSETSQVENYFLQMASYFGMSLNWDDLPDEESDATYAELAVQGAEDALRQVLTVQGLTTENGVTLGEEDYAAIHEQLEKDIVSAVGEGATEDDFNAYLDGIYLPRSMYDEMNEISALYQAGFLQLYGENGEKLSDEDAMAYLEDNDYMAATHILLKNIDSATGEELDEAALAEKKETAEKLAAELQAIEDPQERLARFQELKEEYCEDGVKDAYPDGYVFMPGTMVSEFEETVQSLEPYQVSDPVETTYGYHIIMTLPLDPDALIEYSSAGVPLSARGKAANEDYGRQMQEYYDALEVEPVEGFERPILQDYVA